MLIFYDGILKFVILNTISLDISREYNFIIQNQSIACLVKYLLCRPTGRLIVVICFSESTVDFSQRQSVLSEMQTPIYLF